MKENSDFSNNKNKIENEVFKQLKINSNNISASRSDKIKPLPLPILSNLNKFLNNYVKKEEYWVSLKDYLKRIYYFNEEDFYLGYKNILYCFKPLNLIEMTKTRKHLKNRYSSDSPEFLMILLLYIFIATFCINISINRLNLFKIVKIFVIQSILFIFVLGLIVAYFSKYILEKFYVNIPSQYIEFRHAFDIHTYSFVTFYFFGIIIPYLLFPLCSQNNSYLEMLLSNILVCIGVIHYFYVTLIQYFSLPFIKKSRNSNLHTWPIFIFFGILTIFRINIFKIFILWFVIYK